MKRVCVFCGSSPGARAAYPETARQLAREMARRGLGLVYGGASVGTMAEIADAALAGGAEVIGVIPKTLVDREVAHGGLTELRVVDDLFERKRLMIELSDAFVALPGGLGTLDEIFEVMTWSYLGIHQKPCALLDVGGYWDGLVSFLDHGAGEGFVPDGWRDHLWRYQQIDELLDALAA